MQAKVFSIEKTHQHILFCCEIQSFVSITDRNYKTLACPYNVSVLTIESVARNLVNYLFAVSKVSGTITRKSTLLVCAPLATSSLTFSTRNSILETRDSRLDTRNYRVSSLEARGTVNLLLSGTVYEISRGFKIFTSMGREKEYRILEYES